MECLARAKEWIRVIPLDAGLSMICYTVVTALFHLLGAALLHRQGLVPGKHPTRARPLKNAHQNSRRVGEKRFPHRGISRSFVDSSRRAGSMDESVLRRVWPLGLD